MTTLLAEFIWNAFRDQAGTSESNRRPAPPPKVVLQDAQEPTTDRRSKTPPRKKATKVSSTGVQDEELFTKAVIRPHDGDGGYDAGVAIVRSEKYDIGTPTPSPMIGSRPEGEAPTPTNHSTAFAGLSSMQRYDVAKAIMGECMSRDELTKEFRDCRALLSADVTEVY